MKKSDNSFLSIEQLCEVADEIKGLNSKLAPLGFELMLQPKSNGHHKKGGFAQYWQEIDEIAKRQNLSKAQAVELYRKNKNKAKAKPKAKKVSEGMAKYWDDVRAIAAVKNIPLKEARQIYQNQKEVVQV